MPLGQQPHEHPLDQPVLPDDHALDLEDGPFEQLRVMGGRAGAGFDLPGLGLRHG
ncbi:hypothetical protein GCM10029964_044840 [Kibdelosporangium lantanae]